MNKNIGIKILEYISLLLVISFLLLHSIYLVIFGIILSLYLINRNIIHRLINFITHKIINNKRSDIDNSNKKEIIKTELYTEDSPLSLVDAIEQNGFIPSKRQEDEDTFAA